MGSYFRAHLAPVMAQTQSYLTEKQGEEMKEYSTSLGGILSMMAASGQPLGDPYQTLKATGEWNSKTTEDYIEMCKDASSPRRRCSMTLPIWPGRGVMPL